MGCVYEVARQYQQQKQEQPLQRQREQPETLQEQQRHTNQCHINKSNQKLGEEQQIPKTNVIKIATAITQTETRAPTTTTTTTYSGNSNIKCKNCVNSNDIEIKDNSQENHKNPTQTTYECAKVSKEEKLKAAQVLLRTTQAKTKQALLTATASATATVVVDNYKDNNSKRSVAAPLTPQFENCRIDRINDLQITCANCNTSVDNISSNKTTSTSNTSTTRATTAISAKPTTAITADSLGTNLNSNSNTKINTNLLANHDCINSNNSTTNSSSSRLQHRRHHHQEQQQQQQQQKQAQEEYANNEQQRETQHLQHRQRRHVATTTAIGNMAATLAAACIGGGFSNLHEMLLHARTALVTQLNAVSNVLSDNINYAPMNRKMKTATKSTATAIATKTTTTTATATKVAATATATTSAIKRTKFQKSEEQPRQDNSMQSNCKMYLQQQQKQQRQQQQQQQHTADVLPLPPHLLLTDDINSRTTSTKKCTNNENKKNIAAAAAAATLSINPASMSAALGHALAPNAIANALTATAAATTSAACNYFGNNNYYSLVRNSFSFYAASSVILVLCYLTTTTSAAATNSDAAPLDKHPIQGIDWSKFDESSSDKEILDLLLEKKRYDKRLLPPVNDEDFCCGLQRPDMAKNQNVRRPHNRGTLTVNVNVLLLSLASPDESSLKYEVEFLLNQQWNDPRLQYGNKSHYDFLNALHHHDSIWTPDTYFIMHGDFKDPIIPMHFALRIFRNGTITYAMRRHLILSCQGSLHIFPFDDPKCSFSMESISYEEAQIKYVWKNDEDTLRKSPSLTTLNAYLIKNQTTACDQNSWRGNYSCLRVDLIFTRDRAFYFTTVFIPGIILVTSSFITFWLEWNAVPARSMIGNYSCLQVELTFTRDRAYYFTTVFIPGIILVTSSFITFWLEWNAVPARVMIGVTTMLNFFTTSNGFRSTLPVVSNLTAMNVWDGVCMCFIYASLLEFVCVNYVGRKRPLHNVVYRPGENPVTQRLPAVLSRIGVILASPLEIIEREFHAALSSEKASASVSAMTTPMGTSAATTAPGTPLPMVGMRWEEAHGGIIGAAVQNLRARSIKRRNVSTKPESTSPIIPAARSQAAVEPVYAEPDELFTTATATTAVQAKPQHTMQVTFKDLSDDDGATSTASSGAHLRRSMATNTPPFVVRGATDGATPAARISIQFAEAQPEEMASTSNQAVGNIELNERQLLPLKPPRKKSSRSNSPVGLYDSVETTAATGGSPLATASCHERCITISETGEKRRDAGAPNEIVACTTCGGSNSPCTHSANNGCATETCFVQVRKKEPPHPIRVAKTIDVIARITFPTAYAIFLIFFFVHYKGFS